VGVLDNLHPELQERFSTGGGESTRKMGIELLENSAERSVARMPVDGNRQVVGNYARWRPCGSRRTLGSVAAAVHAGAGRYAVGIDINATHTKSIAEGWVSRNLHRDFIRQNHLRSRDCCHERSWRKAFDRANHQPIADQMIAAQFIFEPGEYDDEFHRLDDSIDNDAKTIPGFLGTDRWVSADGLTINAIYYFR